MYNNLINSRNSDPFVINIEPDGVSIIYTESPLDKLVSGDITRLLQRLNDYNNSLSTNGIELVYHVSSKVSIEVSHYFDHYFQFKAVYWLSEQSDYIVIWNDALNDADKTFYKLDASKDAIYLLANSDSKYSGDVIITLLEEYSKTNIFQYDLNFLRARAYHKGMYTRTK